MAHGHFRINGSENHAVWLDSNLFYNSGYLFLPYSEYFCGNGGLHAKCKLNLRAAPTIANNIITTLMDDTYLISFSEGIRGDWAFVTVEKYDGFQFTGSPTGELERLDQISG